MSDPQKPPAAPAADDLLARELELDPEKAVDKEEQEADDPFAIYRRFSPRRKALCSALVSFAAFLGPVASSSFFPSIPNVAADLGTTAEIINYTCVALFLVVLGIAPLIWAPMSGFYGRRPIFLTSIPIFVAASLGCGFSNSLGALVACRVLQAIGSSSVLSVGAGTIGDLYSPLERAGAMGIFYLGVLLGPSIFPCIAGVLQEYTPSGWKATQYLLAALGVLSSVLTFFFLPETWHGPTPHELAKQRTGKRFVMFWFNPFRAVALLKQTNILLISLNSSFVMITTYCLVVPLTYTLAPRYGISNVAIIGLLYLPQGAGNVIGSRLGGLYADRVVKAWIVKRGYRRPEDRLYSTLIGGGLLVPGSMLAIGWLTETGKGGLAPTLIMYFISGIGLMFVLSSSNTYCVDCLQSRSAEVISINNCIRYICAAGASAGILPLVKAIGVGPADSAAAGIGLLGFFCVLLVIQFGEKMSGRAVPTPTSAGAAPTDSTAPSATSTAKDIEPRSPTSSVMTLPGLSAVAVVSKGGDGQPRASASGQRGEGLAQVEAEDIRNLARTVSIH